MFKKIKLLNCILVFTCLIIVGCSRNQTVISLQEYSLFNLSYGNYEDELQLFDISFPGEINTEIYMKDGFFFIANGYAKKIIQLTSYGDLLGIIYNPDTNPIPSFISQSQNTNTENSEIRTSTQSAQSHLFNKLGSIAVDSQKNIFIVDEISEQRQEQDLENKLILKQIVLRFSNDGKYIDYLGQQGPGGTPFPYIKNIYTSKSNELIVVCLTNTGHSVFWFSPEGFLKYSIPINIDLLPKPASDTDTYFVTLDKVIPDFSKQKLYLKIDYHKSIIDSGSNVQSGIEYYQTALYPFNIETGAYENALIIPPYEDVITDGFSKITYKTPFDFLGVTELGWFFFMIPDNTGYIVQMIQPNGQKIIKRHIEYDRTNTVFQNFTLSETGIISALLAKKDNCQVVWWRTDTLIETILP